MKSGGWFKCANRRYCPSWSIAPQSCTTRPAPYWRESMRSRSASFESAVSQKRRDVAMLGLIHRTVLGCDPRHFASMFQLAPPSTSQKHCWHFQAHRGSRNLQKLVRSTLGLTDVYNLLPARVVEQTSVAAMQHELQCLLKFRAVNREDGWLHTFSPNVSLSEHPLHHMS